MNPAAIPKAVDDDNGDGRWMSVHQRFLAETKEREPDVVFVGDSLIQHLGQSEIWEKLFEPMHALNFGVGGDTTQNVLWRIQNGEMENIDPKIIVLHVGTNNHEHSAEEVAGGLQAIVKFMSEKQPQAYIVVLALLPRGQKPNRLREKLAEVNRLLSAMLVSVPKTQIVNIDPGFIQADGQISHHDMYDYLHLTRLGYQRAFEPVHDLLTQILLD